MSGRGNIFLVLIMVILMVTVMYMLVTTRVELNSLLEEKAELEQTIED